MHEVPPAMALIHVPALAALVTRVWSGIVAQPASTQVAAVRVPAEQLDTPLNTYPVGHTGAHVDPEANVLVQSPSPAPVTIGAVASHALGRHVPGVKTLLAQDDTLPNSYPVLHVC